jgi:hypothetical protein
VVVGTQTILRAILHSFLVGEPWSKEGPTNLQIGWAFSKTNCCFEKFERTTFFSGIASKWMPEYRRLYFSLFSKGLCDVLPFFLPNAWLNCLQKQQVSERILANNLYAVCECN